MNPWLILLLLSPLGAAPSRSFSLTLRESENLRKTCGLEPEYVNRRNIFGGLRVDNWEAPWAVQVNFPSYACSATLISPRHVLTARHCFHMDARLYDILMMPGLRVSCTEDRDQLFLGNIHQMSVKLRDGSLAKANVIGLIELNGCRALHYSEDVLIVVLDNDIPITPACISKSHADVTPGSTFHIFGYGSNGADVNSRDGLDVIRYGEFEIISLDGTGKMSASDLTGSFDTRGGDSGSGYMKNVNGRTTVVGVHSAGGYGTLIGFIVVDYYRKICVHTGVC